MGLRKHGTINATPIGTRSIFCVVIAKQMAGKYNHTNAAMGNARIQRRVTIFDFLGLTIVTALR
jgi:hypothetical protein